MTRARGGGVTRRRHKKIIKMAKGHRGLSHKIFKQANESVMHALRYSYQPRRDRKGDFRRLWIIRRTDEEMGFFQYNRVVGSDFFSLSGKFRKKDWRFAQERFTISGCPAPPEQPARRFTVD